MCAMSMAFSKTPQWPHSNSISPYTGFHVGSSSCHTHAQPDFDIFDRLQNHGASTNLEHIKPMTHDRAKLDVLMPAQDVMYHEHW